MQCKSNVFCRIAASKDKKSCSASVFFTETSIFVAEIEIKANFYD